VSGEAIKVSGLREFQRNLKKLDAELPKALRLAFNGAAQVVVEDARPKVPTLTGKAASTVKARSTQTASRVVGGGNKAPYYPWLDFGGKVGRRRSVTRPFLNSGRYIYDAYFDNRARYSELLLQGLLDVATAANLEVD
jgi:hypothetical protein